MIHATASLLGENTRVGRAWVGAVNAGSSTITDSPEGVETAICARMGNSCSLQGPGTLYNGPSARGYE